jgi:HAD superfamily hydrolase (TIGR01509 family)
MLTALLFDLDGTLTDTDRIHFKTWQKLLQDYHLEIDYSFYKANFSGRRNIEIIKDFLPQLSEEEGKSLSDYKESVFREQAVDLLQPLPGLMEFLSWIEHQSLKRAVVTNACRANADFMLNTLKVRNFFPVVVLAEELERGKPDPLPYQVAMDQLGVNSSYSVAFEDSPSGLRAAVAAGIPTIGISSTHSPELYQLGATLVVPDFTDPQLEEFLHRYDFSVSHEEMLIDFPEGVPSPTKF